MAFAVKVSQRSHIERPFELARQRVNQRSGPASLSAPNSSSVRSDRSNHCGCTMQRRRASAALGSMMPRSCQSPRRSRSASPANCCPRKGKVHGVNAGSPAPLMRVVRNMPWHPAMASARSSCAPSRSQRMVRQAASRPASALASAGAAGCAVVGAGQGKSNCWIAGHRGTFAGRAAAWANTFDVCMQAIGQPVRGRPGSLPSLAPSRRPE